MRAPPAVVCHKQKVVALIKKKARERLRRKGKLVNVEGKRKGGTA